MSWNQYIDEFIAIIRRIDRGRSTCKEKRQSLRDQHQYNRIRKVLLRPPTHE